jgi:hypothetical protein
MKSFEAHYKEATDIMATTLHSKLIVVVDELRGIKLPVVQKHSTRYMSSDVDGNVKVSHSIQRLMLIIPS